MKTDLCVLPISDSLVEVGARSLRESVTAVVKRRRTVRSATAVMTDEPHKQKDDDIFERRLSDFTFPITQVPV
jgi:hypothetical protein